MSGHPAPCAMSVSSTVSILMRICVFRLFLQGAMRICGRKISSSVTLVFRFLTKLFLHEHNSAHHGCGVVARVERLENQ